MHDDKHCALVEHAADTAETAAIGSAEAIRTTATVKRQFSTIIALLVAILSSVIALVTWSFQRVESQGDEARKAAEQTAETTVLRADRRIEERMKDLAREVLQQDREQRAREQRNPDLVTMKR
jgi:hypothetical protein